MGRRYFQGFRLFSGLFYTFECFLFSTDTYCLSKKGKKREVEYLQPFHLSITLQFSFPWSYSIHKKSPLAGLFLFFSFHFSLHDCSRGIAQEKGSCTRGMKGRGECEVVGLGFFSCFFIAVATEGRGLWNVGTNCQFFFFFCLDCLGFFFIFFFIFLGGKGCGGYQENSLCF